MLGSRLPVELLHLAIESVHGEAAMLDPLATICTGEPFSDAHPWAALVSHTDAARFARTLSTRLVIDSSATSALYPAEQAPHKRVGKDTGGNGCPIERTGACEVAAAERASRPAETYASHAATYSLYADLIQKVAPFSFRPCNTW